MNQPVSPIGDAEAASGLAGRIRIVLIALVGFAFATVGSLFMLAVAIVTLFRARRLYSEVIAKRMGQFARNLPITTKRAATSPVEGGTSTK